VALVKDGLGRVRFEVLDLRLKRMGIGTRLSIGFGALAGLTVIVIVFSYLASERATTSISRTTDALAPSALAAARAQANLLRMVGDVRAIWPSAINVTGRSTTRHASGSKPILSSWRRWRVAVPLWVTMPASKS
jgi:hypothetical protein